MNSNITGTSHLRNSQIESGHKSPVERYYFSGSTNNLNKAGSQYFSRPGSPSKPLLERSHHRNNSIGEIHKSLVDPLAKVYNNSQNATLLLKKAGGISSPKSLNTIGFNSVLGRKFSNKTLLAGQIGMPNRGAPTMNNINMSMGGIHSRKASQQLAQIRMEKARVELQDVENGLLRLIEWNQDKRNMREVVQLMSNQVDVVEEYLAEAKNDGGPLASMVRIMKNNEAKMTKILDILCDQNQHQPASRDVMNKTPSTCDGGGSSKPKVPVLGLDLRKLLDENEKLRGRAREAENGLIEYKEKEMKLVKFLYFIKERGVDIDQIYEDHVDEINDSKEIEIIDEETDEQQKKKDKAKYKDEGTPKAAVAGPPVVKQVQSTKNANSAAMHLLANQSESPQIISGKKPAGGMLKTASTKSGING